MPGHGRPKKQQVSNGVRGRPGHDILLNTRQRQDPTVMHQTKQRNLQNSVSWLQLSQPWSFVIPSVYIHSPGLTIGVSQLVCLCINSYTDVESSQPILQHDMEEPGEALEAVDTCLSTSLEATPAAWC